MALRVTQGMMYSSFVGHMNMNLSAYMESNIQASSQKRVNRPSDDPVSAGRILSTRADLSKLGVYEENIEQAMGWLNLADTTLAGTDGSVQSILSTLKSLAEQAATGTYNGDNRDQIGMQARELFEQLITLSNTRFEGRHIFAGHKVDGLAYEQALGTSVKGEVPKDGTGITDRDINVTDGDLNTTTIIRAVGPDAAGEAIDVGSAEFEYWDTNTKEWKSVADVDDNDPDRTVLTVGNGVVMSMEKGKTVVIADKETEHYSDDDPHRPGSANGTWLYVRPTAIYKGDDNYSEVSTAYVPEANKIFDNTNLDISGNFTKDTIIRIDKVADGVINYSYSVNDGSTWITSSTPNQLDADGNISLAVPGGKVIIEKPGQVLNERADPDIPPGPGEDTEEGTQMVIHPHRADINFQISEDDHITVNMVGANIFGGRYDYQEDMTKGGKDYAVVLDNPKPDENLFEVVGDLVGALETNDQHGCQQALEKLSSVMNVVLTRAAEVGGRENRLISQQANTVMRTYAEQDNLSFMEDIDITELMTKLAQQQIAYNSVLKSSSMIMQMSLVNFL